MKRYQTFIIALAFVATLLSSFHVHDDGHASEDCQVCILQHNVASGDIPQTIYLDSVDLYFEEPSYTSNSLTDKTCKSFNSRAPPSFS